MYYTRNGGKHAWGSPGIIMKRGITTCIHVYLETKVNHVYLQVRSLRDDSHVEDLFLSLECRNCSDAAAEPAR